MSWGLFHRHTPVSPRDRILKTFQNPATPGFTLIETMVAMAVLAFALLGLLGLHHQSLRSVIRAQQTTEAAMLAQSIMAEAELERFPDLGTTHGNFDSATAGWFQGFQWQRIVTPSPEFIDVRIVTVTVRYGPYLSEGFNLTEYMHSPVPPPPPGQGLQ